MATMTADNIIEHALELPQAERSLVAKRLLGGAGPKKEANSAGKSTPQLTVDARQDLAGCANLLEGQRSIAEMILDAIDQESSALPDGANSKIVAALDDEDNVLTLEWALADRRLAFWIDPDPGCSSWDFFWEKAIGSRTCGMLTPEVVDFAVAQVIVSR